MSEDVGADRLRELGKQLPYDRPDAERREALRSSLLVAATQGDVAAARAATARKRWWLVGGGFAAGALAAAAIAVVVISPRGAIDQPSPAPVQAREAHARVDAPATAKLEHTVTATASGTDELVRVRAGVVRVAVPDVKRGDRVRMQTADAEVEGTGTYEVAVVDDRLERVSVTDGSAHLTVRVDGAQQQVFLATGQTWRPKIVTADLEVPAQPKSEPKKPVITEVAPPRAPAARLPAVTSLAFEDAPQRPAQQHKTTTEQHFQTGWALLRDGKAREAAVELGAAADAGGRADPLAADARYFQAVALVRAGDAAAAERVLVAFLDSAPASMRRGRAAILLGKILRDRGDTKSARAWFESARDDADPAIAAAARAHLDALR